MTLPIRPDIRRLLSASAVYGLGGVISRLVSLLLLPVFTAYLTPADYGVVALLLSLTAFLSPLATLGLGSSIGISYFSTAEPEQRAQVIWSGHWILLCSAALLGVAGWTLRAAIATAATGSAGYALHAGIAIATMACSVPAIPWQLKLQFEQRAVRSVAATLATLVATTAFSLWFVVGLRLGALGILAGGLTGQATGAAATFALAACPPTRQNAVRWTRRLLRDGLPFVPAFFFLFFLQHGVRWPLEWHHGIDAVGLYSVGATLGAGIAVFTNAFTTAWTPYALELTKAEPENLEHLARVASFFCAVFGFGVCLLFLFSVPITQLLTEPAFRDAHLVIGLAAAAQFLLSAYSLLLPPLYAIDRADNVVVTQSLATLVVVMAAGWLVPHYSIVGAAGTVTLGYLALLAFQWMSNRLLAAPRIPYEYLSLLGIAGVCVAAALVSFELDFSNMTAGVTNAILIGMACGAVLFVAVPGLRRSI